jgi:hypothetical protein
VHCEARWCRLDGQTEPIDERIDAVLTPLGARLMAFSAWPEQTEPRVEVEHAEPHFSVLSGSW